MHKRQDYKNHKKNLSERKCNIPGSLSEISCDSSVEHQSQKANEKKNEEIFFTNSRNVPF